MNPKRVAFDVFIGDFRWRSCICEARVGLTRAPLRGDVISSAKQEGGPGEQGGKNLFCICFDTKVLLPRR